MPRRILYQPGSARPFRLSRSKVELFLSCPRCFYLDRRLGISRPASFPFNLNSAVDTLLKAEFDQYREAREPHPYMTEAGLDAIPFAHEELDRWRANFTGVSAFDEATGFELFGAVDVVWIDRATQELIVVDYKATSKAGEVGIEAPWQLSYKRQLEFYQWLFRRNGFGVSPTGYFVYCNGDRSRARFDERIEFRVSVIPYTGDDGWVEPSLRDIRATLEAETTPAAAPDCEYCRFTAAACAVN